MRTLFLARVPVLFLLVVSLIAGLSYFSGIQPTFIGLFTLSDPLSLFLVALGACSVSLGATGSINLILEHGAARMKGHAEFPPSYGKFEPGIRLYLVCQVPALFFVWSCLRLWPGNVFAAIVAIAGGLLAAHTLLALAIAAELVLSDPESQPPNMLVLPLPHVLRPSGRLGKRLLAYDPLPWARGLTDRLANLLANYALPLLPGYLYRFGEKYKLYPGIIFNTAFLIAAVSVWITVIFSVGEGREAYASLAFALLAILIFLLLFAGAAFFLDRYRIPLSLAVLLYISVVGPSSGTDHMYRVEKPSGGGRVPEFAAPADVMKRVKDPVVIMTAGGGIQSAAWTARVLAGMQEHNIDFSRRIVLISSISGGSLGAYYAAAAYHRHLQLKDAAEWALQPALDEIAWGWTGPDLMRVFLPYAWRPYVDRGWALETKWDRIVAADGFGKRFYFDDLAEDTRRGDAPAFIMNATAIEDGAPFIFTSTAFGREGAADPALLRDVKEFNTYNDHRFRVRVSTAARLSASFPYVAPAARSNAHPLAPDYHVVDGGYYDNFGIRSALDWLVEAGPESLPKGSKIALVEIRWGDPLDAGGSIQGWNYQASAPIAGVLNVRSQGQLRDDDVAVAAFQRSWKDVAQTERFVFAYQGTSPCDRQPWSWKFTQAQSDCVEATWNNSPKIKKEAYRLEEFLK
jgi:predicted acylesterase/phospholipase RssA